MINGVHALMYSKDAAATRAFFRDVLKLGSVDGGRGWLIFALPPAELGIHPADDDTGTRSELHLMCDDVERTVAELKAAGVETTRPIADQGWGLVTALRVPGGIELGIYQPRHPTALHLSGDKAIQRSTS
jgi:predicted enzyme related to lactoylglutathione lyase